MPPTRCIVSNEIRKILKISKEPISVGMDFALEALRDVIGSHKATVAEIERAAEIGRVRTVIRPYLESVVA